MMNQKRSAKYNLLRYLVLSGVVIIALLSLNFSRAAFYGKQITIITDTVPPPPPPVAPVAPVKPVKEVPAVPPVPATPGEVRPPAPPPPPPVPAAPGEKPMPPEPPIPPAPSKMVVLDALSADPAKRPLYVLNGVRQGNTMPLQVKSEDIESISVWKDAAAISRFGEEGRNGVIDIITKAYKAAKPEVSTFSTDTIKILQLRVDTAIKVNTNTETDVKVNTNTNVNVRQDLKVNNNVNVVKVVPAISLKGVDSLHQPLVFVDGVAKTISAVHALPKGKITAIDVLKGNDAIKIYGSKAVNGVINVKTIDGAKQ